MRWQRQGLKLLVRRGSQSLVLQNSLATLPRVTKVYNKRIRENGILFPPFDLEIPNCSYPDFVWQGLKGQAHLPAMVCGLTGRTLTHGEVKDLALRLSAALQDDLQPGSVVGVLLPNCPEYAVVVLGVLHAGLTLTTLNPAYTPHELAHQLDASGASTLITSYSLLEKVKTTSSLHRLNKLLFLDAEAMGEVALPSEQCESLPFYAYLSTSPAASSPKIEPACHPAILPFSSGTTGPPKGVMVSHKNLITQTLSHVGDGEYYYRAFANFQDTTLAILPMFHIFGLGVTMTGCLWSGARQVTLPKFDPVQYTSLLATEKPSFLHLVPPMVSFLASSPLVTKQHLASLREVICGAAPCGSSLISQFMKKAPESLLFKEGWGMTEVGGGACNVVRSHKAPVLGSVNTVLPNFRMRIVDEDEKVLAAEQTGEIQVSGDGVMLGYLNNEEANAKTFTKDRWMRTGDIGHFTEDGTVYISDRLKELIKVKGLQVAPAELEDCLRGLDGVVDVAVVGVADERAGQLPRVFIVPGDNLTKEAVLQHMRERLSEHKQPLGGVRFLKSIPKSASGKILRRELQKKAL